MYDGCILSKIIFRASLIQTMFSVILAIHVLKDWHNSITLSLFCLGNESIKMHLSYLWPLVTATDIQKLCDRCTSVNIQH